MILNSLLEWNEKKISLDISVGTWKIIQALPLERRIKYFLHEDEKLNIMKIEINNTIFCLSDNENSKYPNKKVSTSIIKKLHFKYN